MSEERSFEELRAEWVKAGEALQLRVMAMYPLGARVRFWVNSSHARESFGEVVGFSGDVTSWEIVQVRDQVTGREKIVFVDDIIERIS